MIEMLYWYCYYVCYEICQVIAKRNPASRNMFSDLKLNQCLCVYVHIFIINRNGWNIYDDPQEYLTPQPTLTNHKLASNTKDFHCLGTHPPK